MAQDKTITLRELFHNLGNKHYVGLLGAGITNDRIEKVFNKEGLPLECKEALEKAMEGMARIEKACKIADVLLDEIKKIVYAKINPDEIKVAAADIEKRTTELTQNKSVF